jgi:hypothetical protein
MPGVAAQIEQCPRSCVRNPAILRMKCIASQLACQSVINTTRTAWVISSFTAHEQARDWIHDVTTRKRLPMTVVPLHKPAIVYQRKLFAPLRSASQARLPLPFCRGQARHAPAHAPLAAAMLARPCQTEGAACNSLAWCRQAVAAGSASSQQGQAGLSSTAPSDRSAFQTTRSGAMSRGT